MKDANDRPDDHLPARRAYAPPPAAQVDHVDDYTDNGYAQPAPARGFSFKILFRALKRHWWWAIPLWLVGSAGLAVLAYTRIKPTYDAITQVSVETSNLDIFQRSSSVPVDIVSFMETQVSILSGPTVIRGTLESRPEIMGLSTLRGSSDPEADIRKALRVAVVPKTKLIQVEMSSAVPNDAAEIVDSLVDYYVSLQEKNYGDVTQNQIDRLKKEQGEQKLTVDKGRKDVILLQEQIGAVDLSQTKDRINEVRAYEAMNAEVTRIKILAIQKQADLDQLRASTTNAGRRAPDAKQISEDVVNLFYMDPVVAELQRQRERAEARLKDVSRISRSVSDPAVVKAKETADAVNAKIDDLWNVRSPKLTEQVKSTPVDNTIEQAISKGETELSSIKTQQTSLEAERDKVRMSGNRTEREAMRLSYLQSDLASEQATLNTLNTTLRQLELDVKNQSLKITKLFKPKTPASPDAARRSQAVMASPILIGGLILGLLMLLELRGARVGDPEELSSRMNLQVLGVVPPLPQIRAAIPGGNGPGNGDVIRSADLKAQRQLDEFVQSLDHLRVALCARKDPWGRDKHCVLITSACGSEGKTTLAAQLAERCVNAGLMTLLIDGDLRNPTLSRMLDASDNPGLINVLRGESIAEDVIMVIGDAGGFHLLPAGTPRIDPSRLLTSDRLGKLIAQARESFDMIIVDAPPVLPVPDALMLGKWTDGAVLAVRFDKSRFPLVERAYRRLTRVGVPIIGAVVNGVRSMESSYGGYYAYGYGNTSYGGPFGAADEAESTRSPTAAKD